MYKAEAIKAFPYEKKEKRNSKQGGGGNKGGKEIQCSEERQCRNGNAEGRRYRRIYKEVRTRSAECMEQKKEVKVITTAWSFSFMNKLRILRAV